MPFRCLALFWSISFLFFSYPSTARPEVRIPVFVTHPPKNHFVGISVPEKNLVKAKQSAVNDVIRQIMVSMGAEYDYSSSQHGYGNPKSPKTAFHDHLNIKANWFLKEVEKNVVQLSCNDDSTSGHICFVLVYYPDTFMEEAKRVGRGANLVSVVENIEKDELNLRISEVNNVAVTLTGGRITVSRKNRLASVISYYLWKVPDIKKKGYDLVVNPIRICGTSSDLKITVNGLKEYFSDFLPWVDVSIQGVLKGIDELGRPVESKIFSF